MKKKLFVCLLVLAMIISSVPAYAAGKASVTQENFQFRESYSNYGYAFARIDNVGDKPIKVNAGLLEIYDENGDAITSSDSLYEYCEYLQPDEYTYAYMYAKIEDDQPDPDDYLLTITGKSDKNKIDQRLPLETEYLPDTEVGYSTYDYMVATITNDTDEIIYSIQVVLVLLDEDGNILDMASNSFGSSVGIHPGSKVTVREYVDSTAKETYEKLGFKPATVDAIAYVKIDNPNKDE